MAWKRILLEGDAAVLSNTAPVDVDHNAAAAGTATEASRQDHKHDLAEGAVGDVKAVDGSAAALGTAAGVSHVDHRHALGPLVANLDFNKNQAVQFVAHVAATAPASPVEGQIYYNSGATDKHLYVWVP
jgi:hypothetical protein